MGNADWPALRAGFAASDPSPLADTECTRMLCASRWAPVTSAVQQLLASRRSWQARHAATGVRTALLHAPGWRLQWNEGTAAAVDAEWHRLRLDPSHAEDLVLHCSEGLTLLRRPVQVVSVQAGERAADVERRLRALAGQQGSADPLALWQAVSAPLRIAPRGAFRRRDVVAIASEDNEGVEVVRQLGARVGAPVVYQRYAGSEPGHPDVGAAYVDVALDDGVVGRVHALPRRALASGAALLGARDVRCVLLLAGQRAERGRLFAQEVLLLLQALPGPPAAVVASRCAGVREAALGELSALPGLRFSGADLAGAMHAGAALAWQVLESGIRAGRWSVPWSPRGRL